LKIVKHCFLSETANGSLWLDKLLLGLLPFKKNVLLHIGNYLHMHEHQMVLSTNVGLHRDLWLLRYITTGTYNSHFQLLECSIAQLVHCNEPFVPNHNHRLGTNLAVMLLTNYCNEQVVQCCTPAAENVSYKCISSRLMMI